MTTRDDPFSRAINLNDQGKGLIIAELFTFIINKDRINEYITPLEIYREIESLIEELEKEYTNEDN